MTTKTILYIEDNFQNQRLVRKILTTRGYTVLEAEDAIKGLALAESNRPDLILMDINLPGMDGMEATERLKTSHLKYIPVIALTANAMRGDRERIIAAGCDEYLQKPINKDKLLETVGRFLGVLVNVEKMTDSESVQVSVQESERKVEQFGKSVKVFPQPANTEGETAHKPSTATRPLAKIPTVKNSTMTAPSSRPLPRPPATLPSTLKPVQKPLESD